MSREPRYPRSFPSFTFGKMLWLRYRRPPGIIRAIMRIRCFVGNVCILCTLFFSGATPGVQAQNKALLLFGNRDHKTYLGCLNCVDTSPESVCNDVGEHGSDIAANSIWNDIGPFGSDISPTSPWNDISNDAPIIADPDGQSYGYFSVNEIHHDRTRIDWLVAVLDYFNKTKSLEKTRKRMCGN